MFIIHKNNNLTLSSHWSKLIEWLYHTKRPAISTPQLQLNSILSKISTRTHKDDTMIKCKYIISVFQYGRDTFNKARIMNIAFVEALKMFPYQCFVFHDVDLLPEDDRNMYSCPIQPRHMSVAIDEMGYK